MRFEDCLLCSAHLGRERTAPWHLLLHRHRYLYLPLPARRSSYDRVRKDIESFTQHQHATHLTSSIDTSENAQSTHQRDRQSIVRCTEASNVIYQPFRPQHVSRSPTCIGNMQDRRCRLVTRAGRSTRRSCDVDGVLRHDRSCSAAIACSTPLRSSEEIL